MRPPEGPLPGSDHRQQPCDEPNAPNRLAEVPLPTTPNQLWVPDSTYIQTKEGWLYLAAILDLYSRKIVGWAMSERIAAALSMALRHRQPPTGLLFHSDRGGAIRQRCLSARPRPVRLGGLHESQRQLL